MNFPQQSLAVYNLQQNLMSNPLYDEALIERMYSKE
jgi:hypothetical protein